MKRAWLRSAVFAFTSLVAAGVIVACGGGGGGAPNAPGQIPPTTSPTPCPSGYVGQPSAPACVQVASLPGQFTPIAVPSATALPSLSGYGGTIFIPAAQVATQVTMQLSNTVPTPSPSIPPLSVAHRFVLRRPLDSGTNTPLLYIILSVTQGEVVFTQSSGSPGFPGFTFTLPATAGSGPFYLAWFENGSTWTTVAGPVSAQNGSVTLTPNLASLTITPSAPAYLSLYTGGVVPSTAPTGTPGGQPTSSSSPGASPSSTASSSAAPSGSPVSTNSPTASPTSAGTSTPSSTPTLAPTSSPTATASASAFPSSSPSPTPSPAPTAAVASFQMGTWPSGAWGTSISNSQISGFEALNSSGAAISGSLTFSHSVTISSNNSAVTLCLLTSCSPASSVTITNNQQASVLAMSYSGNAMTSATITASATGATSGSVTFTPTSASIVYSGNVNGSGNPEIDLYAPLGGGTGSQFTFTATQAGYSGITETTSGCSNIAAVTQSGSTFTVTAVASPVAGTCSLTLHGFNGSTQAVIITYTSFGPVLE